MAGRGRGRKWEADADLLAELRYGPGHRKRGIPLDRDPRPIMDPLMVAGADGDDVRRVRGAPGGNAPGRRDDAERPPADNRRGSGRFRRPADRLRRNTPRGPGRRCSSTAPGTPSPILSA